MAKRSGKGRAWTFLLWLESAPNQWESKLDGLVTPWLASPLHDSDVWDRDYTDEGGTLHQAGDVKKAHWHILLTYDGPKTYENVLADVQRFLPQVAYLQKVTNVNAMTRYFCHLDSPNKHKYSTSNLHAHHGFETDKHLMTSDSAMKCVSEMARYIAENNVTSYAWFIAYCMDDHPHDWFPLLMERGNFNNTIRALITERKKIRKVSAVSFM